MTTLFRVVLIIASLLTMMVIIKKVRNAKIQIESTLYWLAFSVLLLIISIFPGLADMAAAALGIYSTPNFVFMFVIFLLLIHQFYMDIKLSQTEHRLNELIEELAVRETLEKEKNGK